MERQKLDYSVTLVADLIYTAKRVVVFTGAGVSTESGIPDFRSPGGIWSKYNPDDFTIQKFLSDSETRLKIWYALTDRGLIGSFQPNPAHYAIAELERLGKLACVITQNIDNLHQKAGSSENKVLELHGNMRRAVCLSCSRKYPIEEILQKIGEVSKAPGCPVCQGVLKPDAIFFGEALPEKALREAIHHSRNCDLFIVVGSTLVVYPAAYMPMYASDAGAKLVIINLTPTPLDGRAVVVINTKAGEVLPKIVGELKKKMGKENKV